jgi:hypothetical protein
LELRFWTDAETGLPHIFDHGVTEEEVQQVTPKAKRAYRKRQRRKNK